MHLLRRLTLLRSLPLPSSFFPSFFLNFTTISSSDSDDPPQASSHIYMSKHFSSVDNDQIFGQLKKFALEHKIYPSGQIAIKVCPFCPKHHHNQRDNMFTLNIKPFSGAFFCFRCGSKGSWLDFKTRMAHGGSSFDLGNVNGYGSAEINYSELKMANEGLGYLRAKNLDSVEYEEVREWLTGRGEEGRGLDIEILKNYKVGLGYECFTDEQGEVKELPVVYFPMFMPRSKKDRLKLVSEKVSFDSHSFSNLNFLLSRFKLRGVGKKNKMYQRMDPTPGHYGIFGLNTITQYNSIVLTEGEFDAMAVNQATGMQAISLPNGANHLPVQILPWLEKFEKIYLWLDADEVGMSNAKKFAEKLGINRTFIVNSRGVNREGPKDANDALREDEKSVANYILTGKTLSQENIVTFSELKGNVLNKILNFDESQGVKSKYMPWINKKLKGFRRGEFTIFSGLTGSGKTTLLSQLSLDFCESGVSTLWGSFEVKNEVLMTNMLLQYSKTNLIKEPQKFDHYASQLENLPLYFMKFFGSSDLEKILATIEYSIYAYDISHVIIDNLQFLLSGQGRGIERFELQDEAVSKFRKLATEKNVHISLVIHPRKVDDTVEINMSSIFGTAKSTQEADNVFLIQNHKGYKVLELKKNRFDGEVGSIALGFDKETKRFFELYQNEVIDLESDKITINDIINRLRPKNTDPPNLDSLPKETLIIKEKIFPQASLSTREDPQNSDESSSEENIIKTFNELQVKKRSDEKIEQTDPSYPNLNFFDETIDKIETFYPNLPSSNEQLEKPSLSKASKNQELTQTPSSHEETPHNIPPIIDTTQQNLSELKEMEAMDFEKQPAETKFAQSKYDASWNSKNAKKNVWKSNYNNNKTYSNGYNNKYGVPKKQLDYGKHEGVSFFDEEKAFQPEDVEEIIAMTVDTYLKKK